MKEEGLNFDRYHGTMCKAALAEYTRISGKLLAEKKSVFYISQRKMPFAPCVGEDRLCNNLLNFGRLDHERMHFLEEDKADLSAVAVLLQNDLLDFHIRCVTPGTIIFAKEPFADISGNFAITQMLEVAFQHAFDEPITVAGRALAMRLEAGDRWLSDFSLRRDGNLERACDVAKYAYIGGFDDTSNMEAAFRLGINAVGTMAHYLVQAFQDAAGEEKHFEQVAFERWLDAHPYGTTLLLDTISVRMGTIHAIRAAKSTPKRVAALKAVRIDSGNLILHARWVRRMLDVNGFSDVKIILTSDLDAQAIRDIIKECLFVYGFGVGTKLAAEVDHVAGVIFKLCEIEGLPTLKCSETPGKETFPGRLQVWRYVDREGMFIKDLIACVNEGPPICAGSAGVMPLLHNYYSKGIWCMKMPTVGEQRSRVIRQLKHFRDIRNYPVEVSEQLKNLQKSIVSAIKNDGMGEEGVIMVEDKEAG